MVNNQIKEDFEERYHVLKKEYDDFVYIVSHDIKGTLRAISNITEWIEDDLGEISNPDVFDNFKLLKSRVSRLENMMNGLTEISRISRMEMDVFEINISKLVDNCVALAGYDNKINFGISIKVSNENCITSGKKLEKVLNSLLDNAVRFHDNQEGNVWLELTENELHYEFRIIDNGPGIPNEVSEKIFNVFYTVNSKDVKETTGVGLTISNKTIKRVGGILNYTPNEERGSIFSFNWPKINNYK
jgi:signal transduction histidine kinase